MIKDIFESKEEKKNENEKEENIIDEIKYNTNNTNNSVNNDNALNLNSLFKNIELQMNNDLDNDFIQDNNKNINEINEIEEKSSNSYLKNIKDINEIENNDILKENIEIKEDKIKYNKIQDDLKIKKENDLKENISDNIKEEEKISKNKIQEKIHNEKEINIINKQQQIYQPKKTIKRKSIKNNNKKIKPTKIDKNIIKKEINKEEFSLNELNTAKGRENNLGLGITLTSSDNDIYKSNTVKNMPVLINKQKLSTLSENELLKNIILDTAKKIKNHNINNTSSNISLEQKSNMNIFSPINTIKSETIKEKTKKIFNKTFENGVNNKLNNEENKKGMNTMNPLDMMNQIITTNSNISNDTQEQINNKFNITTNNNIYNKDSDLLEYSKSYVTNNTHLNNTEENNINNNNGNINNINNNSSSKKMNVIKRYHIIVVNI